MIQTKLLEVQHNSRHPEKPLQNHLEETTRIEHIKYSIAKEIETIFDQL